MDTLDTMEIPHIIIVQSITKVSIVMIYLIISITTTIKLIIPISIIP